MQRSIFRNLALSAISVAMAGAVSRADITGQVKLHGTPPKMKEIDTRAVPECSHPGGIHQETVLIGPGGELKNVVISIKKDENQELPGAPLTGRVVLDQKGCTFTPHVLAMMTGQQLVVKNSDPFLHNVHSLATVNGAFNKGQPTANEGEVMDPQPKDTETFRVKCDIHPWMGAWVAVFDHPYFAVTSDDGAFIIKSSQLPDGEYTLQAWHEKYGTLEQKIIVKAGQTATPTVFTFEVTPALAKPRSKT